MDQPVAPPSLPRRRIESMRGFGLLLTITLVGLFVVKWNPSFDKALIVAESGSLGPSIISGTTIVPPPPSLAAGLDYALGYFGAIWQAMALGLLVAATVESLLPRDWLARVLGSPTFRSSALGGLFALPGMLCSCCAAPIALGLHKRGASTGSAVAFFLGNPTLNPAVLVFLVFTLGWQWAMLRLVVGTALVFGTALVANHLTRSATANTSHIPSIPGGAVSAGNWIVRWLRSLVRLTVGLVPEYVAVVAVLGAARAFLFPALESEIGSSVLVLAGLAVAGTLFAIPTAGEIPVLQAMMAYGMESGPAGVLLMTLAPLSLPSLLMVARVFPRRVLVVLVGGTVIAGMVGGLLAHVLGL